MASTGRSGKRDRHHKASVPGTLSLSLPVLGQGRRSKGAERHFKNKLSGLDVNEN